MRRFRLWAQRAGGYERAEAASALARAYLHADLDRPLAEACVLALTALVDDPHVAVRRALAEAFAGSRRAPRALIVALANDCSEVAAPALARSPLLTDAELVDAVAAGDALAQCVVARREGLGPGPAAALAEVGSREAALALIENVSAAVRPGSLRRLIERFGADAEVMRALEARAELPAELSAEIVIAAAGGRAERDAALAAIIAHCPEDELCALVGALRAREALSMALLLRSLLGGERAFFAAALAELAGLSVKRAAGFVRDPDGAGFGAAARRAGLPPHALPVFRAALAALARLGAGDAGGLKADLIAAVISAAEAERDLALAPFLALLWRFAAEAARAEARAATPNEAPSRRLDFVPANDDGKAVAPEAATARPDPPGGGAPPVELPADLILALDAA